MDKPEMLMACLIVLIICLVAWFINYNNYVKTRPDDDLDKSYYKKYYASNVMVAMVVGALSAIGTVYLYSTLSPEDTTSIWGGGSDDNDTGSDMMTFMKTPEPRDQI